MIAGDIQHGALVANTVKTVTLAGHFTSVTVLNRTGTGEIFFTVDGSDPVIEAEGSYICPGAIWAETLSVQEPPGPGGEDPKTVTVKLLSSAAGKYSVLGQ